MAISTNPQPTIYRNLYENTVPDYRRHIWRLKFIPAPKEFKPL